MSITAEAWLGRRPLALDRARALFNGFGYILTLTLLYNGWSVLPGSLGELTRGDLPSALHTFLESMWLGLIAVLPGPILTPIVVNTAPRSGLRRAAWLLAAAVPMFLWCEYVEGITYSWSWQSAGYILSGLLTTLLVVAVCAYHSDSRAAADALVRSRIERTRLDSELQRARLQLLRAQIEPHFLFNTLSVVRALGRNDRIAAASMLDHLIHYFGAALPRLRASEVALTQEIELVEAYLAIYRARMGTRLEYEICVPQELGRLAVPSMALLTLVENALKHGVSRVVQGGFIHVSATRERDMLLVKVADSGRGLDVRQGCGMGLANVRQRLLMMYGPRATLSLRLGEPRGVVASISLPAH